MLNFVLELDDDSASVMRNRHLIPNIVVIADPIPWTKHRRIYNITKTRICHFTVVSILLDGVLAIVSRQGICSKLYAHIFGSPKILLQSVLCQNFLLSA